MRSFILFVLFNIPYLAFAQYNTEPHNLERKGRYMVGISSAYYFDSLNNTGINTYRELSTHVRVARNVTNRWTIGVSSWLIVAFPDNLKQNLYTITGGYADYNFLLFQGLPMYAEFGLHYSNYCYKEEGVFRDNNLFGQFGLGINPKIGKNKQWNFDFGFHSYRGLSCRECTYGLLKYRIGVDWIVPSFKNKSRE